MERLIVSVNEAAELLGVSDDLIYELTERGDLPCLRLGRRKVIPRRAIDLLIDRAVERFDPAAVLQLIAGGRESELKTAQRLDVASRGFGPGTNGPTERGSSPRRSTSTGRSLRR